MTTSTLNLNASLAAPDIGFQTFPGRVRVEANGITIADSTHVVQVNEGNLEPVFYFPADDVRVDLLESTDHHSFCPFRGDASYWSLKASNTTSDNIAWSYLNPFRGST